MDFKNFNKNNKGSSIVEFMIVAVFISMTAFMGFPSLKDSLDALEQSQEKEFSQYESYPPPLIGNGITNIGGFRVP